MSLAVTKRKKSIIVLAWIAPIVAIIISSSMVFSHYTKIGNDIEITFSNIDGLDVRQSHIQYNGLNIGDITSMKIRKNNIKQFIVKANIYSQYNYLIKEGSVFYKVSPTLSINGVKDLSNILKGNYIELIPATNDLNKMKLLAKKYSFHGLDTKPQKKGVLIHLTSNSGDFDITSSILYKGLQIGEVITKTINKFTIDYQILIYEKYRYLISSKTKFYKMSPFELKASLEGIKINIPSLQNVLSSAIGFETSQYDGKIKFTYILYDSKNVIHDKNDYEPPYSFTMKANDIPDTDLIYFKGVIVGKIDSVKITNDLNKVTAHIKNKYKYLINNSTIFYKQKAVKANLSRDGLKVEVANMKELVMGGVTFTTPQKDEKLTQNKFEFYENIDKLYVEGKFQITLKIKDNYNLTKFSKLYYKNIEIASVKDIELKEDILVTLEALTKYKYLFGKDSKIYLKGATISLEKIENLSSTVLGDRLYLIADKNNDFKSNYTLDAINPDDTHYKKGLRVQLKAKESKNISKDSPIYYKGFEIGKIYGTHLTSDGEFILFDLFIEEKYRDILKKQSKFYKATIIDIDASLFGGAKIKMGSAKTMLKGGIEFQNELEKDKNGNIIIQTLAMDGTLFELLEKITE